MKKTKKSGDLSHAAVIVGGILSFALLVSSALFATVCAQVSSQTSSGPIVLSKKLVTASSSHSSRAKVTVQLTFDNGAVFTVTQFEGEMIRAETHGQTIGISTHIDSDRGNQVTADVFSGIPMDSRGLSIKNRRPDISLLDIGRRPLDLSVGTGSLKIELVGISYEVASRDERKSSARFRLLDGGGAGIEGEGPECCVTCSGNTACGCRVDATCGSCCVGGCC